MLRLCFALVIVHDLLSFRMADVSLRGFVISEDHKSLLAAAVEVEQAENEKVRKATVASDGSYFFTGLPPGTYNVVISAPSYYPETI